MAELTDEQIARLHAPRAQLTDAEWEKDAVTDDRDDTACPSAASLATGRARHHPDRRQPRSAPLPPSRGCLRPSGGRWERSGYRRPGGRAAHDGSGVDRAAAAGFRSTWKS